MTSTLEKELTAAGYTPEPVPIDGDVVWTGWRAPDPGGVGVQTLPNVYEMYYGLCESAMYAQMDEPPWERYHPHHQHRVGGRCPVLNCLVQEYRAVVNCWRSASQVAPVGTGFTPEPDAEDPPEDDEVCADCGCFRWYCQGPGVTRISAQRRPASAGMTSWGSQHADERHRRRLPALPG